MRRNEQLYDREGNPVKVGGIPKWLIALGILLLVPVVLYFVGKILRVLFGGIKVNKDNLGLYIPGYRSKRR